MLLLDPAPRAQVAPEDGDPELLHHAGPEDVDRDSVERLWLHEAPEAAGSAAPAVDRRSAGIGLRVFWIQDPSQGAPRNRGGAIGARRCRALASVKEQWNLTLRAWRESAPFWEKHAAVIRAMFEPLSSSLIEAAGVGPDDLALDVASGVGEPALQIAATRKPALVVCTDAVREMVIAAKRVAARSGASNLGFAQCAAEALPFRSGRFAAVVCRLGAMFFTAPVASLREMVQVLARHVVLPAPTPDGPGAFRYAQPGKLAGLLAEAGAQGIQERAIDFQIEAPVRLEDFWPLRFEMSDTLRPLPAQLSPERLRAAKAELEEAIRPYFPQGRMRFPARAILVSGRR